MKLTIGFLFLSLTSLLGIIKKRLFLQSLWNFRHGTILSANVGTYFYGSLVCIRYRLAIEYGSYE